MEPVSAAKTAAAIAANNKLAALALVGALAAVAATATAVTAVMLTLSSAAADSCAVDGSGGGGSYGGRGGYVSQEPSEEALSDIPGDYLELYRASGEEYGIDWTVLAAIGKVETDHGRYSSGCEEGPSTAYGTAKGPMQFIDSTWATSGVDGNGDGSADPCDPEDAIPSAAEYLRDSGAPDDYYAAVYAYNHADWYVQEVFGFAEQYRAAEGRDGGLPAILAGPATSLEVSMRDAIRPRPAGAVAQGWDLVDSNGNLHYESYTRYGRAWGHAVEVWSLGSVDIESSPSSGEADVKVGDITAQESVGGTTYSDGSVLFNTAQMDGGTENAQNAVAAHELGHTLGLGHTAEDSVMNAPITLNSTSNHEVPTAYDEEVYYGLWGEPSGNRLVSDRDGGPGGEMGSDASAVFPLPEEYLESYEDTWGASRGWGGVHEGTDIFAPDGTEVYSITDGTVVPVSGADGGGWNELGGWTVMVEASESIGPIQAGDMLYYAHMMEPSGLQPGESVEAGDVIGKVGSTGEGPSGALLQPASRGRHLHLGWYDPSGAGAEAASGAMNPYPLLEWLRDNGGTASGGDPSGEPSSPGWCPPGLGGGSGGGGGQIEGTEGVDPGSGDTGELLDNPNFEASPGSIADLESGIVDERLVAALQAISAEHSINVTAIKSDHPYGATLEEIGMPGVPNSHYYGRTADIAEVDGMPVAGNGDTEEVLEVGRILAGLPPSERPDEIIGPAEWHAELGYPREAGFITDSALHASHSDHVHAGFASVGGTSNTQ